MNHLLVPTPLNAASEPSQPTDTHLHGGILLLTRTIWLVVALFALGLVAASIPGYFAHLIRIHHCTTAPCSGGQPVDDYLQHLHAAGLSIELYATYGVILLSALTFGYFAVGWLIFWRKSSDRMALFASFFLVTFIIPFEGYPLEVALRDWQLPLHFMNFLGSVNITLFFYLFPNGHFVPRWTRWLVVGVIVYWGMTSFFPHSLFNPFARFLLLNAVTFVSVVGSMVIVQIYRYRRVSNPVERQQTKWVVFGTSVAIGGFLAVKTPLNLFPSSIPHGPFTDLGLSTIICLFMLLIPLSIGFAILRSRLFEIDLIINRTLVYATLTAIVLGLYVLVVGGLGLLFQTRGNFLIALLATGLIAVLFQPLRTYLQRNVNRLIYGERDDPYTVLSRLRQRLEVTLTPAAVLPTIVETVAPALKLPYVAIMLKHEDNFTTAASYGTPGNALIRLPLIYQAEQLGELLLAPRALGEKFSTADQRLLHDLANEIGVAVHATRLTADLQRLTVDLQHSRERLVLAREEERRRLRRDLHDDLGPTLAALALTATTVGELIPSDPTTATTLATDLQNEIRATVGNVRRLVYELRPPTLDELGLIAAVRERAAQVAQQSSAQGGSHGNARLQTRVHAPEKLPPLPAAVEVAAYRIVQEALTNVEKHAQAHSCAITIACDDVLQIEIVDDGIGLPTERHRGVGLHSMRERAAELGGTCVIEKRDGAGTRVCARLPLPKEQ